MINFTCTFASTIYFITYTYCKKLYISETGRRLGDRFRAHDVEGNDKDISKPVAKHLISLIVPCSIWMAVFGLSLHLSSSGSRKALEQNFLSQTGTLNRHGINERFFIQPMKLAFKLFTEANLRYQLSCQYQTSLLYSPFNHLWYSYEAACKIYFITSKSRWRYNCFVYKQVCLNQTRDPCLVRKWKHAQFYFISFDEIQLFYQNASQTRQNHCLSSFFQSSIWIILSVLFYIAWRSQSPWY